MLKTIGIKKLYVILTLVFFLAFFITFVYTNPISPDSVEKEIKVDFARIFFNNLKVSLILLFSGPLTLGLGTIGILIFNAIILGNASGIIKNDPSLFSLLIPHGIIEIPILIFAASVGMHLTINIITMEISIKRYLQYILIVILGLFIAAGIETFITPIFLKGV